MAKKLKQMREKVKEELEHILNLEDALKKVKEVESLA